LYLKRLEMVGFKSFADKIRLDFLPGVTAVVGPNGSGKSNISDALRWVLGEQSIKTLRGSKMDDIIFAGSAVRKPLSLAEVTMILDNSDKALSIDFSEVSVTRKLFRSGESDYLINKSSVRLRDVLELFYDTGLGKEAYSVIGQGKIDAILSAKAEERRIIFEEAAGIIKYKTRKQVAERKLDETDRNLVRLRDILAEIENQLGPLGAQASLAEQFLSLKEQLTNLEINHFGAIVKNIQTKLIDLEKAKNEVQQKYNDFEGQESIIDSQLEEQRLRLLDHDNKIGEMNEDYYRIQNQIDKSREQVTFLEEKLVDLEHQRQEYQNSQDQNLQRKVKILQEQAAIDDEIMKVSSKQASSEVDLGVIEQVLADQNKELLALEAEEQNFKNEVIEVLNEIAGLKNKMNSANLQKDFAVKQISEFQKKVELLTTQLRQLETDCQSKKELLDTQEKELSKRHQTEGESARKILKLEEELSSIEEKNLEWKDKLRGLESKISLLDEMERGFQGYFQGVKAILAETEGQPFYKGVRGIVADLMKVQPGMELAVETALGSSLQHIVIEHDQQAQDAVNYLKQHGKGRATFLPLNLIQGNDGKILQYQGVLQQFGCQPLISILQFSGEYRNIMNYLLNTTVVAPDLKTAVRVGSKLDKSFRIVTPEGDLVNPGGSITGGSIDKRRLGLLSRRREIEDLKKDKMDAEAFLEKGRAAAKLNKEQIQTFVKELEQAKVEGNEIKLKRVALDREIQTVEQNVARIKDEVSTYTAQLEELLVESQKYDAGKEEYMQLIEVKEGKLHEIEVKLTELAESLRTVKFNKEETVQRITELKSRLSANLQEQQGKIALKGQFLKQIQEIDDFLNELKLKQEQIEMDNCRIKDTLADSTGRIEQEKLRLKSQENLINQSKQAKDEILVCIKDFENRQRNFRRKQNDFQNQLYKIDLTINQNQLEVENILNNLKEDYGSEWMVRIDASWAGGDDVGTRIEQLKMGIRDLGTVNLAAIDDYQQLEQRYEFLNTQSQDLIKAKESLLKVIGEIERTITKRFTETFQEVRNQFTTIYSKLFEGGNADLYLADPEHPLESGIEISAQPPGKKLQSLMLLSGGERSMTAIALLFSILAVKPSPFCVLDEIDASLDEVNVQRFSKCLELFSKDVQFIVVTHRRGTMEAANAIYGVTMEELGVSKLISLDLNQKVG
jgi:chromosome segregation protein